MKKFLAVILLLLIAMACKDDDVVPNRVIFKITLQDPQYGTSEKWIVLKDNETGELIDSRQLAIGEPTVFESTKKISGNKMTVTYFRPAGNGGNALVFRSIDVGTEWTQTDDIRNKSNPNSPLINGTYSLTVNNAPEPFSFTVSDKFGPINLNVDPTFSDGKININPGIRTGFKQIITIDPIAGKHKYAYVDNPSAGLVKEIDYNTFKEFDKYVKPDFPGANPPLVHLKGYETNAQYYNGYELYASIYDDRKSEVNLGFLNDLQTYRIDASASPYTYNYLGPVPTTIKPQASSNSFTVSERDRLKYAIKADADYNYTRSLYSNTGFDPLSVVYYDPKSDVKHFEPFTDEIISKYSLNLSALNYISTEVNVGTQTYSKLVDYYFAAVYDASQPFEITTIYYSNAK